MPLHVLLPIGGIAYPATLQVVSTHLFLGQPESALFLVRPLNLKDSLLHPLLPVRVPVTVTVSQAARASHSGRGGRPAEWPLQGPG